MSSFSAAAATRLAVRLCWSCVGVARTIRKEGGRVAMVNFNPETVSTDYDESDSLYFEELSLERVLVICDLAQPTKGTFISVGGQIPNDSAWTCTSTMRKCSGLVRQTLFSALCDANGIA